MSATADPEKGLGHVRRESEIERPASHDSTKSDEDDEGDEDGDHDASARRRDDDSDNEKAAAAAAIETCPNDLVPAATVGEPSGSAAFACGQECCSPTRARSRASSNRSRAVTIVPRARRRGLFAALALIPEVERPYEYKRSTKWAITTIISLATAAAPMGSSIFYPALPALAAELHASQTVTNMSIALYMLSMSIFPLWWSAFSEQFGRRTIYLVSFALFVVFAVLSAVSTNVAMLIVFRIGTGGASASVQAVGAGTIADIWETFERGRAMSMFYLGPLLGPLLAPIIGGVLAQELGWRSCMWFLAIYGVVIVFLLLFLLPETLAKRRRDEPSAAASGGGSGVVASDNLSRVTTAESAKAGARKVGASVKRYLFDPLKVLLLLRFPAVTITVLVAAFAFAALFIANVALQQSFSAAPYSYRQLIVGLLYIPPGLGYFVASFFGGSWMDSIMAREARKANRYDGNGKLVYLPEDRMKENAWIATTVYPLSLLAYGWTLRYGVHWAAPSVFMFIFGVSSMLVFGLATTMLTEFVRKRSSSGVAVNNFVRNILSCVGTIVAAPWVHAIGTGWVFTAVCIFCLLFSYVGMWTLRRYGPRWRTSMDEGLQKILR